MNRSSSAKEKSRIVASPSRQVNVESQIDYNRLYENVIVEKGPIRRRSVKSSSLSRGQSMKSLNVISDDDDSLRLKPHRTIGDSSDDNITSSELYDARALPSSDDSNSFVIHNSAVATPIADRFSTGGIDTKANSTKSFSSGSEVQPRAKSTRRSPSGKFLYIYITIFFVLFCFVFWEKNNNNNMKKKT